MKQHDEILKFLKQFNINGTINADGTVDVNGDVNLTEFKGTQIPVQFRKVGGGFYCYNTQITSLQGAPQSVGGNFSCNNTKITSLQGAPQSVGGNFSCYNTKITSLQGAPQSVGGDFICGDTKITSLHGIHKIIKQINDGFTCDKNVTHILGLLLIDGITEFKICDGVDEIMNKYRGTGDIIAAQDELIDAGFTKQARL